MTRPIHVLGISAFYHDSAAASPGRRDRRGGVGGAFTRKKGDPAFPAEAVAYCLREAGISMADLDYVGFYDKPLLKFERILETYLGVAPRGFRSFLMAGPLWIKEKLYQDRTLREALGGYDGQAAVRRAPRVARRERLLPVAVRGGGHPHDGRRRRVGHRVHRRRTGQRHQLLEEIRWPDSLGLLYSAFTYYTGFKVNSGEYKVMGLAPYGEPKYVDLIYKRAHRPARRTARSG